MAGSSVTFYSVYYNIFCPFANALTLSHSYKSPLILIQVSGYKPLELRFLMILGPLRYVMKLRKWSTEWAIRRIYQHKEIMYWVWNFKCDGCVSRWLQWKLFLSFIIAYFNGKLYSPFPLKTGLYETIKYGNWKYDLRLLKLTFAQYKV